MPELTDNQIAYLRVLQNHCGALGAELVVIGAIAYQVHFPAESRHTGDIDFAIALELDEFAELERRLLADGWVRFADREHRWRSVQSTILDLIPAGPRLRDQAGYLARQSVHHESGGIRTRLRNGSASSTCARSHLEGDLIDYPDAPENRRIHGRPAAADQGSG